MSLGKIAAYFTLYGTWIILGGFAFYKEKNEAKHAYMQGEPKESNSVLTLLRKIQISSGFEINTIKWRRALLAAVPAVLLVFLLVLLRFPTPRECILSFLIVFSLFYILLKLHQKINVEASFNNIKKGISLIREKTENPIQLSDLKI
jgi:hypothetical protein